MIIRKELNSHWRRSREEKMTKLRSKLILLSEYFYILRKREANENKKSLKEEDIKKFMNKLLFSN